MTFAHPWMLLGLGAALIPLLVHLFDRRRPKPVPFAALAFVLRSQRRTASRLKLKRLLLYALRTLIFLAIPLALAKPSCGQATRAQQVRGVAATAIVIDQSLGMRYQLGRGTLFDSVQSEAKSALAELGTDEPAAIVGCGRGQVSVEPLGFDKQRLRSTIDGLKAGAEAADLNRCLDLAARALDESPLPNRRLVVVSPFFEAGLRLDLPAPVTQGPQQTPLKPEVVMRRVADGETLDNRAIVDVKAEAAPQAGLRAWMFTFTVRNFSDSELKDVPLELRVEGVTVGKGFVDVPAHGTSQKSLTHRFTKGGLAFVEGALGADALPDDDVRALALMVPKEVRVLLVNGSPSPQKYKDEAYFVEAALSASGSPARAVVRDSEAAWREDFKGFDAIFLLNVEAPPAEVSSRLTTFVQEGGGLFVSMGDRVEVESFNARLGTVLPRRLRVIKTAVEPGTPESAARAAKVGDLALQHPVLSPFTGRAREGLTSTRFFRYALFEAEPTAEHVEVLASLDDGAPFLMSARPGRGRVLVFGSTVDRDWTDAPVRTAFLPLIQRITSWLAGSLDEADVIQARVGQTVHLDGAPAGIKVEGPGGVVVPVTAEEPGVVVGPLSAPGPHRVVDSGGAAVDTLAFAATLDVAASDLARHPQTAVAGWFGDEVVQLAGVGGGAKTPAWTWLFVVAALAFFFEGLLLRSGS